jgi:hypothetical protein
METHMRFTVLILHVSLWYMSLFQYRSAKWFKGLVQLPSERAQESKRKGCFLPSPTQILDKLQSQLAPVVALLLWVLLMIGTLPRSWFYIVNTVMTWVYSMRTVIAITTKRARSIARIAEMQGRAPGTIEDKRRRMRTLKGTTVGVVLDLCVNIVGVGVTTMSYIAADSYFSSRRLIVNYAVTYTTGVLVLGSVGFRFHKKISREQKLFTRVQATHARSSAKNMAGRVVVETELDGMSVVEQSCVDGNGGGGEGGLFSEVETNAQTT